MPGTGLGVKVLGHRKWIVAFAEKDQSQKNFDDGQIR